MSRLSVVKNLQDLKGIRLFQMGETGGWKQFFHDEWV